MACFVLSSPLTTNTNRYSIDYNLSPRLVVGFPFNSALVLCASAGQNTLPRNGLHDVLNATQPTPSLSAHFLMTSQHLRTETEVAYAGARSQFVSRFLDLDVASLEQQQQQQQLAFDSVDLNDRRQLISQHALPRTVSTKTEHYSTDDSSSNCRALESTQRNGAVTDETSTEEAVVVNNSAARSAAKSTTSWSTDRDWRVAVCHYNNSAHVDGGVAGESTASRDLWQSYRQSSSDVKPATMTGAAASAIVYPLYCNTCRITLNAADQARQHFQGKYHARRLRLHGQTASVTSQSTGTCDVPGSRSSAGPQSSSTTSRVIGVKLCGADIYCRVCSVVFNSQIQALQHYTGKLHRKRIRHRGNHNNSHVCVICGFECKTRKLLDSHIQSTRHILSTAFSSDVNTRKPRLSG